MADLKLPYVWIVLFPIGLVTFCNTVQLNSNLTLVFDYLRFFSDFLRVSDQ